MHDLIITNPMNWPRPFLRAVRSKRTKGDEEEEDDEGEPAPAPKAKGKAQAKAKGKAQSRPSKKPKKWWVQSVSNVLGQGLLDRQLSVYRMRASNALSNLTREILWQLFLKALCDT